MVEDTESPDVVLFAVEEINKDPSILPNTQLKAVITSPKSLDPFNHLENGKVTVFVEEHCLNSFQSQELI